MEATKKKKKIKKGGISVALITFLLFIDEGDMLKSFVPCCYFFHFLKFLEIYCLNFWKFIAVFRSQHIM